MVEAIYPDLESLEVSFQVNRTTPTNWSPIEPDRAQQYRTLDGTHVQVLKKLRHIGLRDEKWSTALQQELLKFIGKYRLTLTSAIILISCGKLTRSTSDFILQVSGLLPELKSLALAESMKNSGVQVMDGEEFFRALTMHHASPSRSLEQFSVPNINCLFSPAIGQIFGLWTKLKFLRLGDKDNPAGLYDNDGRPDFDEYAPV